MIIFSRTSVQRIKEHAKREMPKEACGILAGRKEDKKWVARIYECKNVDEFPESHYTIDAREQLEIMEEIDNSDLELLGFYHSHPFGSNYPSMIDIGRAMWPNHSYVIISPSKPVKITSWIWKERDKGFIEEKVKILD